MAKKKIIEPNIFVEGMKSDSKESYQSKKSYRYANNARLINFSQSSPTDAFADADTDGGASGGLTPYPSDRMALNLNMNLVFAKETSLSYPGLWGEGLSLLDSSDALLEGQIRIEIYTSFGSGNQFLGGNEIENNFFLIETPINESFFQNNFSGIDDANSILTGIVNNNPNHPFQLYYVHAGNPLEWGTETDVIVWYAFNSLEPEDTITEIRVTITGGITVEGEAFIVNETGSQSLLNYVITPFETAFPPFITAQVLGQYSFSDYMVLLGTFNVGELNNIEFPEAEGWASIGLAIMQYFYEYWSRNERLLVLKKIIYLEEYILQMELFLLEQ
jgi:hypothetical protein